jgi:hypothetical protein
LQLQHRRDVPHDRCGRALDVFLGICLAQRECLLEGHSRGHVAVQHVVRAGLIGDDIRIDAASNKRRQHVGRVAKQADRDRILRVDRR